MEIPPPGAPMKPNPFFQACGGREAIGVVVQGEVREFTTPVLLAGRDPKCEFALPAGPDRAFALVLFEGRLFYLPLSDAPVLRNDAVARAGWIEGNEILQLDGLTLQPVNPSQPGSHEPAFDPLSSGGAHDSDLAFEPAPAFRSRKAPPRLTILPRLMLIGRDEPARFKVSYDGVEPAHALLLRTSRGPWIADLTHRHGTLVNDAAVSAARLRHGDHVALGSVELIAHTTENRPVPVSPPTVIVAPAAPVEAAVGPILQQVAQFQQQTFEQFREMLGSVTEMFGSVMQEHRAFVREELTRLERVAAPSPPQLAAAPLPPPPPPPREFTPATTNTPIAAPGPGYSAPPPDVGLHIWLQEQLGGLEKAQSSRWQRLVEKIRKK